MTIEDRQTAQSQDNIYPPLKINIDYWDHLVYVQYVDKGGQICSIFNLQDNWAASEQAPVVFSHIEMRSPTLAEGGGGGRTWNNLKHGKIKGTKNDRSVVDRWCHIEGLRDLMKGSQSLSLHFDVDRQMAYSEMDTTRKYDWKCKRDLKRGKIFLKRCLILSSVNHSILCWYQPENDIEKMWKIWFDFLPDPVLPDLRFLGILCIYNTTGDWGENFK